MKAMSECLKYKGNNLFEVLPIDDCYYKDGEKRIVGLCARAYIYVNVEIS